MPATTSLSGRPTSNSSTCTPSAPAISSVVVEVITPVAPPERNRLATWAELITFTSTLMFDWPAKFAEYTCALLIALLCRPDST